MSRHGEGWFERYLPGYTIEWYTYNAGPTAMEALFGRTADLTYVGPSPALNAYAVSAGREVRLLAGAVNGGAALMVAPESGITRAEDFKGRSIATPQLGNTQDVSCRAWLTRNGLSCTLEGAGDCRVAPTPNSMQLQLMKQGDIDACWTVEPWVSRMESMADARILVQEPDVVTTVLVGRVGWLKHHPQEAATIIRAHRELTQWILDHPEEAQTRVVEELTELTQAPMEPELVSSAWKRLKLTTEIDLTGLQQFVDDAQKAGLLDRIPPLDGMIYKQD
jgi:NitT/TauT family transport system substrate-binding protein